MNLSRKLLSTDPALHLAPLLSTVAQISLQFLQGSSSQPNAVAAKGVSDGKFASLRSAASKTPPPAIVPGRGRDARGLRAYRIAPANNLDYFLFRLFCRWAVRLIYLLRIIRIFTWTSPSKI